MLKIGAQDITGMYVGGKKIKKAYLGEDLVFGGKNPSRLPDGYTELEYVSTDNYTVIPTGIIATTSTTRVTMSITPQERVKSVRYLFLILEAMEFVTYVLALRENSTIGKMRWYAGASSVRYGDISFDMGVGTRIDVDMDTTSKRLKIGEKEFSITPPADSVDIADLRFGGMANYSGGYPALKMHIHSGKVFVEGELKGDFVPCINPDRNAGLFNVVDNTFHPDTYGTLTPGPTV